ncbi:MAG TPA: cob(I)yrinic acid a,c-diamide adenosyltransferase, partial [Chitinophagaceae bacterium]|nr:cob(I)yrinic acid a,c-diamide adenosyltransferase [Chitinophagaceae bacterium]
DRLFSIGSSLACDPEKETRMLIPDLHDSDTRWLEEAIDRMNETLPELKQFILPGGDVSSSHIHIARCVCRRAERICVQLKMEQQYVNEKILIYLNRLSDYLFVLSRYVLYLKKGTETVWNPRG